MTIALCQYCNKEFKHGVSRPRKYCSMNCYRNMRRIEQVTIACSVCNKNIFVHKANKRGIKHCSKACKNKGQGGEIKICETCGKGFHVMKYEKHRRRFCSSECFGNSTRGKRPTTTLYTTLCIQCEKNFSIKKHQLHKVKFCSQICYGLHRRTRRELNCLTCGKLFWATQGRQDAKYCSIECVGMANRRPVDDIPIENDGGKRKRHRMREMGLLPPVDWNRNEMHEGYQTCTKCLLRKSTTDFYMSNAYNTTQAWCKVCTKHLQRRRRARINNVICTLTLKEWNEIITFYNKRCAYCGIELETVTIDHIIPISRGGDHTKNNVVPACKSCNSRKHTSMEWIPMTPDEVLSL